MQPDRVREANIEAAPSLGCQITYPTQPIVRNVLSAGGDTRQPVMGRSAYRRPLP